MSPAYNLVIPQDKMESCVEYSSEGVVCSKYSNRFTDQLSIVLSYP